DLPIELCDIGFGAQLETRQPCDRHIGEPVVDVEDDRVVRDTRDATPGTDLALRLEQEAEAAGAHRETHDVLTQLPLQVGDRIGTCNADDIPIEHIGANLAHCWPRFAHCWPRSARCWPR